MDREVFRALFVNFAKLTAVLLVAIYIGSYVYLSRRGLHEAGKYGMDGFLYVPLDEAVQSKDLSRHQYLKLLYMPLNVIDHAVLGTNEPVVCMMFDLS